MQLMINGQTHPITPGLTINHLIEAYSLDIRKVAIEHNTVIVPRSHYAETVLCDGDRLEIVQFIGGG